MMIKGDNNSNNDIDVNTLTLLYTNRQILTHIYQIPHKMNIESHEYKQANHR